MSSNQQQPNEAEKNVEIWKVKKLIKSLEMARGNGTSMISLIIRMRFNHYRLCIACWLIFNVAPKDQVSRASKMLAEEFVSLHICLRRSEEI